MRIIPTALLIPALLAAGLSGSACAQAPNTPYPLSLIP